eukprot:3515423-Pyramimonas_sp.AAC.1
MLPALYRVWARLRRSAAREWKPTTVGLYLAHQAGHSIVELEYKQSLECESNSSAIDQPCSAQVLYDLSNYYEHVGRPCLAHRAVESGCPCCLLRIILSQYASERIASLQDCAVSVGKPWRGIAAGCSWAAYLVQMYVLAPLGIWTQAHSYIRLA